MADNVVDILLRARMEAGDVASGVNSIQKALNGLTLPKNVSGDLEKQFAKIGPLLKDYQKQLDKGFKTSKDLKNLELLKSKITDTFGEIKDRLQDVNGQEIRFKADTQEIAKLEKELDGLQTKLKDKIGGIYKSNQTDQSIKTNINNLQKALSVQFKSGNFKFPALKELTSGLRQALNTKDFVTFNSQIDNIRDKINSLSASSKINIADSLGLKYAANDANAAGREINKFLTSIQVNKTAANSIETLRTKITETGNTLQQLKFDSATRGAEALGNTSSGIDQLMNSLSGAGQSAEQAANGMLSMQQQVDQLKTSTQYFFSLRNMINLLKQGVSQAVDTIKELDAAMTETAVVVPEWDVGDMWAKLPEYTQNANKLGATVVDLYKATTLYYQQGLRGNEVMDIAAETMKMARIGGLEAADATDKMTAALRGFNMEINQESAQRINDVYSNLAANTASNTEELGTAMQRTASIAASAGMSFEGTAAFLAQAIETTREPAENLGTAMKTIVARFTELKKNPLEISEVDGEEVSYNKVDTALQSIGVSLKDTNGQFRDLDQVFLDISQRWDSLTQTQQRYIATQAAGSRQQSRFIAMMSNYQRTTELMDFANNSEGASQEQFEKTMESLEAKMNKLKNAWDAFLMGITDNQIVKGAVDGLTALVGGVNKLIDALSLGVGPLKSFMSLMAAFTGLKMGGRFVNSMIGGLGGLVDPASSFGAGFKSGMVGRGNPALASQIYNPIVAAIHELGAAMGRTFGNGSGANSLFNKTADQIRYDAYKAAHQEFKNIAFNRGEYENKNATVNDLTKALSKLDTKDQNFLGKAFFNTTNAARQAIFGGWNKKAYSFHGHGEGERAFGRISMPMLNKADKAIYADVKNNSLPLSEYFKRIQDPGVIRQALDNAKADTNSPIYKFVSNLDKGITERVTQAASSVEEKIKNSNLSDEKKQAALDKFKSGDFNQKARDAEIARMQAKGILPNGEETFKNSGVGKVLDHISGFGSSMASAGMGLRSFGSLLQQSANPAIATFGTALTTAGSLLSTIGMGVTGLTSAFSSASASISAATGLIGGAATALTAGLFALVGVVAAAIILENKRRADIKKRAEEITTNYKDKTKETSSNISDLQTWQDEMPRLAKGVDKNGNNINLDASDYQHYLEIVDRIAELNPEIVKGYNAQGHAIVDNNTALQKTLDLQKDNQRLAVEEYTSDDSIKALIEARDLNKTLGGYTGGKRTVGGKYTKINYQDSMLAPQKTMMEQAKKMVQSLTKAGLSNEDFKDFGIDLSALEQGNQAAISALSNNIDKIKIRAKAKMQEFGDEVSDSTKEAFDKSVSGFTNAASDLDEMITPLYDALSAKMSNSNAFQNIPDDMVTYFNQGLKNIAADSKLSFDEMMSESRALSNEFVNLTAKGTDYDKAMDKIAKAQEKFGENLDTAAYDKAADDVVKDLNKIKDGVDSTSTYGQALTEFLDNQIAQVRDFTKDGVANVAEALNTMTDRISAAEGALESFKKVEEGSNFSTAADNLKEIYDTVTEKGSNGEANKHAAGLGDQSYWAAAEAIFGRDNLKSKDKAAVDKMFSGISKMMQEGETGALAFRDKWVSARKELEKINGLTLHESGWLKEIDEDVNPEAFKEIADTLGMSEDTLTAMLNKARQFVNLDFSDLADVRKGLATSESTITGIEPKNGKGKRSLYIKEEALYAEFANAGITNINEQEKYRKRLESEQNVKTITEAAKIGIEEFKDMGIHSQESLISILNDTGQFTKDEIQEYAESYSKAKFNKEEFDKQFAADEALKDPVAGAQLESLKSLDAAVATIVDILGNQRIAEGHLDNPRAEKAEKMLFGENGNDTEAQRFWQGKNAEGGLISRNDYIATGKSLDSFIAETNEYLQELEEGRKNAKTGKERDKFRDEIERFEYMLERAKVYRDEAEGNYHKTNDKKIAKVNEETNGFLDGKTWEDFKGKKGNILDTLYQASQEPISAVTDSLITELHNAGLHLKDAYEAGLITDEAYKAYTQKAKKDRQKRNDAEQQGKDEADEETNKKEQEKRQKEAAEKARIAAEQRERENAAKNESTETEKQIQEDFKKQQQEEAAKKARVAAEQRARENAAKFTNTEEQGAFDQYTPEEAQKAGQNLKNWWNNLFKSFKMDTSENALGFSSEDIDTSGLDSAAEGAKDVADGAKAASDELEKNKNSITNVASAVTSGLNYANKGVKTFVQNAKEASSSSLQGKPKEKGTTIPGVGYVDKSGKIITGNGSKKEEPKKAIPENQTVTLKIDADYTQVTAAKKEINSTIKLANKGAELKVTSTNDVESTQKKMSQVQKQASKGVKGGKVSFSTSADTSGAYKGIDSIVNKANKTTAKVKVTSVKADGAYDAINALKSYAEKSVSFGVNVKPGQKRSFSVSVKADYLGQNNTGAIPSLSNLGSAATGTSKPGTGRLGPKGRGGLTLTGELGYEVAWLPRQHRSMILGVNGPEMVNLPGDAVVWNHEQSKQIVKKNQIPSGSAAIGAGSMDATSEDWPDSLGEEKKKGSKKKGKNSNSDKENKKNSKKTGKAVDQWIKWAGKIGKITNWWENISRKVEGAQRIVDKNQKDFEKVLKAVGTTLSSIQGSIDKYQKSLETSIKVNQEIYDHYTTRLENFDKNGGSRTKINKYNTTSEKASQLKASIDAAGSKGKVKYGGKKISVKSARKKLKQLNNTAKKQKKNAVAPEGVATVTWDDTAIVKKGSKKKKQKVKRKAAIDFSEIVYFDPETGAYIADTDKINNAAKIKKGKNKGKVNKKEAQAIQKKANEYIDTATQRRNTAEDKINAAREALNKLADDTYNMFNRWEKSLTETYLISKKLEALQKKSDIYDAQKEYITARTSAGYHTEESFDQLQKVLIDKQNNLVEQLHANVDNIEASFSAYQKSLNFQEYYDNFLIPNLKGINGESETANNDIKAAKIVFDLMKEYGLNSVDTFDPGKIKEIYKQYAENEYNNETDTAVQKVIDRIAENQGNYLDAIQESYGTLTEVYNTLNEYEEYINDFEESLLKGFEEEINKEIDKQEKLNSALTDAFKDLIDEVKRRLDQRREVEDNAKTESDISKKQQRLAVLRADTSGGHASEIRQLEQEIADAQQQYGRTLEDQLLNRLQEQGDEAAKQRERQIKLLEIQRDLAQALGTNLEEVKRLLENPEENYEQIRQLWLTNQGYDEALPEKQEQLEKDWLNAWDEYRASGIASEELRKVLGSNELNLPADYQTAVQDGIKNIYELLDAYINKGVPEAEVKTDSDFNLSTAKEKGINAAKAYELARQKDKNITYEDIKNAGYNAEDFKTAGISAQNVFDAGTEYNTAKDLYTTKELKEAGYTKAQELLDAITQIKTAAKNRVTYWNNYQKNVDLLKKNGLSKTQKKTYKARRDNWKAKYEAINDEIDNLKEIINSHNVVGKRVKEVKNGTVTFYKTGGLATETGPAWLDGTRAKPELVLNATDTKNFIALKDVLSSVMNGVNSMTDVSDIQGAPVTYDININVDHLNNDYDVDRVADRVKKIIVQDASYRNVTAVRKFR